MSSNLAHDEAFEQGVGGEAVGAVETRTGGFANGIEIWDIGGGGEVGLDAPDLVVGSGVDRDGISRGVDAEGI